MKDEIFNIVLGLLLILYGIIYQIFILDNFLRISEVLSATAMITILFVAINRYHFRKDINTDLKSSINKKVLVFVILYFLLSYLSGLIFGFQKNAYSMRLLSIINNILMPIVILVSIEIYRYVMLNSSNKYSNMIFTTIFLIMFEVFISIRFNTLFTIASAFKTITIVILPIISKNIMLSYISKYGGLKGPLIYRLVLDTYVYFVPIVPNFSDYLKSMVGLCFPLLIYIGISNSVEDYKKIKVRSNPDSRLIQLFNIPIIVLFVGFIFLISGYFSYTIVGIASNSMQPALSKGDAVIIRKVSSYGELKVGDIIAYQNNEGQIIVHRIVEIDNESFFIKTKGDMNKSKDKQNIKMKDVKGIVKLNLKYVGMPSVYFNELKNKR